MLAVWFRDALIAAAMALAYVTPVSAQTAVTPQLQQRAQAAVSEIRGSVHVQGLKSAVRVQRDRWGIAHIYARNSHDLFFAQGYVVAQDRLFQMELWKRSGQGRLAEVLGAEGSHTRRECPATALSRRHGGGI